MMLGVAFPARAQDGWQSYEAEDEAAAQAVQQGVPVDNDAYYVAPGNVSEDGGYYAAPDSSGYVGCQGVSDSPQCLGD